MSTRKYIHDKIYLAAAILIVAFLPFSIQLCSWSIILLTANWLVEGGYPGKWKRFKSNPFIWLFASLFALYVAGLLYTTSLSNGFFSLEKKLSLLIFPLLFGTSRQFEKKELNLIFYTFIASSITAVLISAGFSLVNPDTTDPLLTNFDAFNAAKFNEIFALNSDYWNTFSYVGLGASLHLHPTYFSLYLSFSVFLIAHLHYKRFRTFASGKKWLITATVLFLIVCITLLSSRIVILSFFILVTFFMSYFFNKKEKYVKGLLSCFAFGSAIFFLIYINPVSRFRIIEVPLHTKLSYPPSSDNWNSWNLRLVEWQSSVALLSQNPIFGVGTGDASTELNKEYASVDLGDFDQDLNAHNQYLQTAITLGLTGLLYLSLSFVWPAWVAYKKETTLFLVFIFLFGMCCLTEAMLEVQKGVVFYGFFNSLLAFQVFHLNPNAND